MSLTFTESFDYSARKLLGAASRLTRPKESQFPVTLWGEDPPVVMLWDYRLAQTHTAEADVWRLWKDSPALIIVKPTWEIAAEQVESLRRMIETHRARYPRHRVACLMNSEKERRFVIESGADVVDCNQNALVHEHIFTPVEGASAGDQRRFDAVYNARFARYKRHHLAVDVRSLALIHYTAPDLFEPIWWGLTRWRMRHAHIVNRHSWGVWPQWIGPKQVAATYNRSRVGLCLSAVEGAMLSSIQYLLCGLPVVTTPSVGGRDVFFDEENSLLVEPDAKAVAEGVREMIARKTDPWRVRQKTLARMAEHRARLVGYVEQFQRENGVPEERWVSKDLAERLLKYDRTYLK